MHLGESLDAEWPTKTRWLYERSAYGGDENDQNGFIDTDEQSCLHFRIPLGGRALSAHPLKFSTAPLLGLRPTSGIKVKGRKETDTNSSCFPKKVEREH